MKKYLLGVVSVVLLMGAGCNVDVNVDQQKDQTAPQQKMEESAIETGDTAMESDKTSAPTEATEENTKPAELSKEAMEAELKTFFEAEKKQTVSKIQVTSQDGAYVRGEILFAPTTADETPAGALFFVKKENGGWKISHFGNGQIPCSLQSQGFPKIFLWDCAE